MDDNNINKDGDIDMGSFDIDELFGTGSAGSGEAGTAKAGLTAGEAKPIGSSSRMEIYDWVQSIVFALVIGIMAFMFLGRIITVDGPSMNKTLYTGDKVVTSNLFYKPKFGDIVVLQTDTFNGDPLVKRIIATEGQVIDIDFNTGTVYIDGIPLEEEYIADLTREREDFDGPLLVPEGHVFVMGDNRNYSTDSRSDKVGLVDTRRIIGKVYWIIFPGKSPGGTEWSRIGSVYKA